MMILKMTMMINLLMFMNNLVPLIMMMMIFVETILVCNLLWLILTTAWICYILFLIFLGALMILFVYMCSLSPNSNTTVNLKWMKITLITVVTIMTSVSQMKNINQNNNQAFMFKMMTEPHYLNLYGAMFILLLTLMVAVSIIKKENFNLRTSKI